MSSSQDVHKSILRLVSIYAHEVQARTGRGYSIGKTWLSGLAVFHRRAREGGYDPANQLKAILRSLPVEECERRWKLPYPPLVAVQYYCTWDYPVQPPVAVQAPPIPTGSLEHLLNTGELLPSQVGFDLLDVDLDVLSPAVREQTLTAISMLHASRNRRRHG